MYTTYSTTQQWTSFLYSDPYCHRVEWKYHFWSTTTTVIPLGSRQRPVVRVIVMTYPPSKSPKKKMDSSSLVLVHPNLVLLLHIEEEYYCYSLLFPPSFFPFPVCDAFYSISISSSPQVSTTFQVSFLLFQADFFLLLLPTLSLLLEDWHCWLQSSTISERSSNFCYFFIVLHMT